MDAEIAYLFRHALLRDASYDLQLPASRAALHKHALEILEDLYGGLPPEPTIDSGMPAGYAPLPIDEIAAELADHAEWAAKAQNPVAPELQERLRIYLKRAALRAERSFQNRLSARLWRRASEVQQGQGRAHALLYASRMEGAAGLASEAETLIRAALAIVDVPDDEGTLLPECLVQLGHLCSTAERMEEAEQHYQRGMELCERHNHARLATTLRMRLGHVCLRTGRLEDGSRLYTQALAESRERGALASEALSLAGLASATAAMGRHAEADEMFEQALEMHRQQGDRRSESLTLGNMASYLWSSRQWQRAEDAIRRVLPLHREVGNRLFETRALGGLASCLARRDQPELAMVTAEEALAIDREIGNPVEEGIHLCTVGRCLVLLGRLDEAQTTWRRGIAQLREHRVTGMVEYSVTFMREVCAKTGVQPFE